jgi:hypothetical protein
MSNTRPVKHFLGRIADTHRSSDLWFKNYIDRVTLRVSLAGKAAGGSGGIVHPSAPNWGVFPTPSGARPKPDRDPLGNIECGDCVFAGPGHQVTMVGQQVGDPNLVVTTEMVKAEYSKRTGYNPVTGANDTGYYIRDMIEIWSTEGLYGTKCLAACAVDKDDQELVAAATWCGCGLIGGYDLPDATETQYDSEGDALWFVPAGGFESNGDYPGKRGGHCMYSPSTSPAADGYISWGELVTGTNAWRVGDRGRGGCCSELWLILIDRWIMANGRAPNGFALEDLLADWGRR